MIPRPSTEPGRRFAAYLPILGYIAAIGLLGASVWYALEAQRPEYWRVLLTADIVQVATLLTVVFLSTVVLPGAQFWLASVPFVTTRPLSFSVMLTVCAASALLNYTPVKAGLIGRIGYLRYTHGIGYRASFFSHGLLAATIASTCFITFCATVLSPDFGWRWAAISLLGLALASLGILFVFRLSVPKDMPVKGVLVGSWAGGTFYLLACMLLQAAVLVAMAARWWIVFDLLGESVDFGTAWMLAILHIVAVTIGPANGLGLREWLVGWVGGLGLVGAESGFGVASGVAVSLVDRGIEASVVVVVGSLAIWYLKRIVGFKLRF